MATVAAKAVRRAHAQERLQHAAVSLCDRFGIEADDLAAPRRSADPELTGIEQTERIAGLLERLDDAVAAGAKGSTTSREQRRRAKQAEAIVKQIDPLGAVLEAAAQRREQDAQQGANESDPNLPSSDEGASSDPS